MSAKEEIHPGALSNAVEEEEYLQHCRDPEARKAEDIQWCRDQAEQRLARRLEGEDPSSYKGLDGWKLYELADQIVGDFSHGYLSPEETRRYAADTLLAAGFPPEYLERTLDYAQLDLGDLSARSAIRIQFEDGCSKEELEDREYRWLEIDTPREQRAQRRAELEQSVARYNEWVSGRVPSLASAPASKLYDFPIEAGQLRSRYNGSLPSRAFVVKDFLPAGITALLSGHGGVNKTRLLTHLAVCIATGRPFLGMATTAGAVVLVLGEDDQAETDRRLAAIVHALALTPDERQHLDDHVLIFSTAGEDIRLTGSRHGSTVETGLADRLVDRCKDHEARCGVPVRLVGFDHMGLVSGGDPNDNTDATLYNQQASRIVKGTGATVMTLAHHRKSSANQDADQHATMGSAAHVNTARWAAQLNRMTPAQAKKLGLSEKERPDYIRLSTEKANGVPTGDVAWLRSVPSPAFETTVLERVELTPAKPDAEAKLLSAKEVVWDLVKEHSGRYSISDFAQRWSTKVGLNREKLRSVVRDMVDEKYLTTRPPTDQEREVYELNHRTKHVLITLTPMPSAEYRSPQEPVFEEEGAS